MLKIMIKTCSYIFLTLMVNPFDKQVHLCRFGVHIKDYDYILYAMLFYVYPLYTLRLV